MLALCREREEKPFGDRISQSQLLIARSPAHHAAELTYCAEEDSVLSGVVGHVEHRELGTTEGES